MSEGSRSESVIQVLFTPRMLLMLMLGFASGLPLLLTGSTLQAWMKDEKVDLAVIGLYSLVGLPYTLKFLWSPLFDRFTPPFLGRRRGWTLITQMALMLALGALSFAHPSTSLSMVAILALGVTFCSASQDIVLDAYRREILPDTELGLGSTIFINGYRLGMLLAGAGALFMADRMPWQHVYQVMAASIALSMVVIILAPEPPLQGAPPRTLKEAVVDPFVEYFQRPGAWEVLAFILFYKLGDTMASAMTTPFVLDLGFSKTEFAAVAKSLGLAATIGGGLLGGLVMVPLGIRRSLWIFGFFQMISILSFVLLAKTGKSLPLLAGAVVFENASWGMGTAAFAAFMASLTNKRFTATQYALLSSLMGIPRVLVSAPTGWLAERLGWSGFYLFCTAAAIPGLLLLQRVAPWSEKSSTSPSS